MPAQDHLITPQFTPLSAADRAQIRSVVDRVRKDAGTGGQCGFATEVLGRQRGWGGASGVYHSKDGEPIGDHTWSVHEPSNTIIDSTADQFGEGHSIRVLPPGHPERSRYRQAGTEQEENSMLRQARALRKSRGDYWWAGGPAAPGAAKYAAKVKRYEQS